MPPPFGPPVTLPPQLVNEPPPNAPPDIPRGGGGLLSDLFGGQSGQNLPTSSRRQMGRDALLQAGLSLLQNSGGGSQGEFTPNTLQAIAQALSTGQESFAGDLAGAEEATAIAERERLLESAIDPASRREAFQSLMVDAVARNDTDAIANLATAMDAVKNPNDFTYETVDKTMYQFDQDGNLVRVFGNGEDQEMLGALTDAQFERIQVPLRDFNQSTRDVREVPTQFRRVVVSATPLSELSDIQWGAMATEDKKDLSFAAVSALSSYARLIDPNSVVRTSEMELLLGQGSWAEKIATMVRRAVEGTMSPRLARALIEEAKAQTRAQKDSYEGFIKEFEGQADAFAGVSPETARRLIINPYDRIDIDNPQLPGRGGTGRVGSDSGDVEVDDEKAAGF